MEFVMKFFPAKRIFSLLALILFLSVSCKDYNDLPLDQPAAGNADLSTYAAVGNSLTAGFQSNALYRSAQEYSFPNLLAQQIVIDDFEQPLISDPGIGDPGRLELVNVQESETVYNTEQGSPANTGIGRPYNNLGVPGAQLADYLNQNGTLDSNPFYPVIINNGDPQQPLPNMHAALENLQPTLVTFWLGNNDILGFVTSGGLQAFTDPSEFATEYGSAVTQIQDLNSDPTVVTLNIPPVSAIPFATTIGPQLKTALENNEQAPGIVVQKTFYEENQAIGASENRDPAELIPQENLNITSEALVLLTSRDYTGFLGVSANPQAPSYDEQAVTAIENYWRNFLVRAEVITEQEAENMSQDQLEETLTQVTIGQYAETFGSAAAGVFATQYPGFEFDQPFGLNVQNPFPNQFVLDANEISITNTVTGIYNTTISNFGDIQIDIAGFFSTIVSNGGYQDPETGEQFAPVIGSLFSLDGIHPSNKAQGIIANRVIDALNGAVGSEISKVDLRRVPEGIPISTGN